MRIGKYAFDSKEQADSKIDALGEEHKHTIVNLGHIVIQEATYDKNGDVITELILSDKCHVDVMWIGLEDHPYGWKSYAVDLNSNGMHSFLGVNYIKNKM